MLFANDIAFSELPHFRHSGTSRFDDMLKIDRDKCQK